MWKHGGAMSAMVVVVLSALLPVSVHAQRPANPARGFLLPLLPYGYDALQPVISEQIMRLHHTAHHAAYVRSLNTAMNGTYGGNDTLPGLLQLVGARTLPRAQETAVRRHGGGHYNHALFWKIMAPPGGTVASTNSISSNLSTAISDGFGSFGAMKSKFTAAANGVFGSGWVWLAVPSIVSAGKKPLVILTSANQENPLMKVVSDPPMVPIMGLDVWEHAYYLQYFAGRANYTSAWWRVVNWEQVSRNYESALKGDLAAIGAEF